MSILNKIKTGPVGRAQKTVLYGAEGVGKSTLSAQFPNPLFLDLEGGTAHLSVRRLTRDELPDFATVRTAIREVAQAGTDAVGTVVIDTADWLEQMAAEAVIAREAGGKFTSIEGFGYGKGYTYLREELTLLLADLDRCIRAGQHVVLLAHSRIARMELPDSPAFDRYELKMSKQVTPLIKEWADLLMFGNFKTLVQDGKAVGGKKRVLYTERTAAIEAKNRLGLEPVLEWSIEPIRAAFLANGAPWGKSVSAPKSEEKLKPVAKAKEKAKPSAPAVEEDNLDMTTVAAPDGHPVEIGADPLDVIAKGIGADKVNQWLTETGKIEPGQTYADLPAEYKARILKRPDAFKSAVLKGGAK
jgi:hypothetical protein